MYYEFYISTDVAIERGIVGFAEMPDLLTYFMRTAEAYSAKAFQLAGGMLIAELDDNFVVLSLTPTRRAIPSRCVFDCIEDAMEAAFGCVNVKGIQRPNMFNIKYFHHV